MTTDKYLCSVLKSFSMNHDFPSIGSGTRCFVIVLVLVGLACLLPCLGPESSAQPAHLYIIDGSIFDPDFGKVPNATMTIENLATGEVMDDQADENGNYSANLANLQEGWEEGDEIRIFAMASVHGSVTFFPKDDDPGGSTVNVTLPYLMIIAPRSGEKIRKEDGNYTVRIDILNTLQISRISYTMDSLEFGNSTDNSSEFAPKDYKSGAHKIRVILYDQSGQIGAQEIVITLESEDEGFDSIILYIAVLLVVVISLVGFVLLRKVKGKAEE